jgi:hypothetical protein
MSIDWPLFSDKLVLELAIQGLHSLIIGLLSDGHVYFFMIIHSTKSVPYVCVCVYNEQYSWLYSSINMISSNKVPDRKELIKIITTRYPLISLITRNFSSITIISRTYQFGLFKFVGYLAYYYKGCTVWSLIFDIYWDIYHSQPNLVHFKTYLDW